jgi:putative ABC transport system permease protein
LIIALIGGLAGLLFAVLAVPALGRALNGLLPNLVLSPAILALGLVLAILVGLISGMIPGFMAMRMRVISALRRV